MDYITFTAENASFPSHGSGRTELPGIGHNHDVWIMTSDGEQFWKVTDYPENWGSIRPSFSHDGTQLYWNEEWSMEKYPGVGGYWSHLNLALRKGEEFGLWRIKIADISFGPEGPLAASPSMMTSAPALSNARIVPLPPSLTLIEGEGLSPDDERTILSACNVSETEGRCLWGDIYTLGIDGAGALTRLTRTPYVHDENGTYSPDGSVIVWGHVERGRLPGDGVELYLIDTLGETEPVRLTYFTEPGHGEYDPIAQGITEISWSPDGGQIVFGHDSREQARGTAELRSSLWLLTLGP
jgi:Tol biopolymer transport system component